MGEQGWVYYSEQTMLSLDNWGVWAILTNYATVPGAEMPKSPLATMCL